jgi:putative transcriptional regulator
MMNETILHAAHETAKGLHKAGAMDAPTMCEFDALHVAHNQPLRSERISYRLDLS